MTTMPVPPLVTKQFLISAALVTTIACGGGGGGSTPTPNPTPTAPTPPAAPTNTWSITGRVVDTIGGQPLSGVTLTPDFNLASIQTGNDGSYQLGSQSNPPTTPYKLTVSGGNLLSREVWVTWQSGPRADVNFDAIRLQPPFSMAFYQQFVRGAYDEPGTLYPLFRLTDNPRFYLKTVDQNGRAVEPEVLAVIREAIPRAVRDFTGGKLSATLEEGTAVRAEAQGWINVDIVRDPNEREVCGFALIGSNPGAITLNNDVCSCGSNKIPGSLVVHEVGHALGFFHVPDREAVMYPFAPGNCPSGVLTAEEKLHAAIAYSRPRGNRDPDVDPVAGQLLTPAQPIMAIERR
jgi:hypothetical protein